jgi:hypothetical protein
MIKAVVTAPIFPLGSFNKNCVVETPTEKGDVLSEDTESE